MIIRGMHGVRDREDRLWTPKHIKNNNVVTWLDGNDTRTMTSSDNVTIDEWKCKLTSLPYTQSNPSAKPIFGQVDGRNAVRFSGSQFVMSDFGRDYSQPMSYFAVFISSLDNANYYVFDGRISTKRHAHFCSAVDNSLRQFAGSQTSHPLQADYTNGAQKTMWGSVLNNPTYAESDASRNRLNGAYVPPRNPWNDVGTHVVDGITIGQGYGGAFTGLTGYIMEFVAIEGDIDNSIFEKLEGWAAHKWGMADKLPASHRYKDYPPTAEPSFSNIVGDEAYGLFYDISDLSTLYEDIAGTIPASVDGPVGYVKDKSGNGLDSVAPTEGQRPTLKHDSIRNTYYLQFDATDTIELTSVDPIISSTNNINCIINQQISLTSPRNFLLQMRDTDATFSTLFRMGTYADKHQFGCTAMRDLTLGDTNVSDPDDFITWFNVETGMETTDKPFTLSLMGEGLANYQVFKFRVDRGDIQLQSPEAGLDSNTPYTHFHNDLHILSLGNTNYGEGHGKLYSLFLNNGDRKEFMIAEAYLDQQLNNTPTWTPAELSSYRWYDYSDPKTISLDTNNKISEVKDQNDETKVAVQSTESFRPLLGDINGTQCMDMSSITNGAMIDTFGETLSQQFYIFAVGVYGNVDGYMLDGISETNRSSIFISDIDNNLNNPRLYAGAQLISTDSQTDLNSPMQVGARFNATNSGVELNGGNRFEGDAGTHNIQGLTIGNRFNIIDITKAAKVGEVIVLPYTPSTSDIEKVQGYLAHKWGLVNDLPISHSYKDRPPLKDYYPVPEFSSIEGDPAFGLMYDISNLDTLYEDIAGTVPASVDGPVGKIVDLSNNGFDMTATSDPERGILRLDSTNNQYYIELTGANYQTTFTKAVVSSENQINVCMHKQMLNSSSRGYLFELTGNATLTSGGFRDGLYSLLAQGYTLKKDPGVFGGNTFPDYSVSPAGNPTINNHTYTLITKPLSDPNVSILSLDGVQQNLTSGIAGSANDTPYWLAHSDLKVLNIGTTGLSHGKLYGLFINNGDIKELNKADQYFRHRKL